MLVAFDKDVVDFNVIDKTGGEKNIFNYGEMPKTST